MEWILHDWIPPELDAFWEALDSLAAAADAFGPALAAAVLNERANDDFAAERLDEALAVARGRAVVVAHGATCHLAVEYLGERAT